MSQEGNSKRAHPLSYMLFTLSLVVLTPPLLIGVSLFIFIVTGKDDGMKPNAVDTWHEKVIQEGDDGKVAVIYAEGVIGEDSQGGFFQPGLGTDDLLSQLDQAKDDPSVHAVVVRVNSPGGSVVASNELYQKILEIKYEGKPVLVSMGETAASGGYYISAPADRIYANPYTITGSLGVIMSVPDYSELAEKIGYRETVIKSGELKDIGNALRDLTEEEVSVFQTMVTESYDGFVDVIAKGRNMKEEEVRELADGRIYTGIQAKENGLIDGFKTLDETIEEAKQLGEGENESVVEYQPSVPKLGDLLANWTSPAIHIGIDSALKPGDAQIKLAYILK
ncbi:signal peptide peptidase SppA (plasmid) [Pontibacillus sp. ALD_SL1]|uniref:signal peptide peptidase SppA n=1 Tax=Pontibacillus sp. ALD_SL1 TaxID=2777185 RepID=UPI001A974A06|nr:signal peptide peptidase SppA [Pontibacillus sp. ALD_SL1]QST02922.1 signal peptide peptidase SppA [Pontibacillus sp. ALD_SL1]